MCDCILPAVMVGNSPTSCSRRSAAVRGPAADSSSLIRAASVPMALDVAVRDGRIKRGDVLLLEAFGGGFTWGACLLRY